MEGWVRKLPSPLVSTLGVWDLPFTSARTRLHILWAKTLKPVQSPSLLRSAKWWLENKLKGSPGLKPLFRI